MKPDMVRAVGGASSSPRRDGRDNYGSSGPEKFREGDKVEGNYRGRGRWYPGRIKRVNYDDTYDIDYDDGEKEARMKPDMVRAVGGASSSPRRDGRDTSSTRYREGDKIEADYRGRGRWYPGRIKRDNYDGTYDIDYDDGEKEMGVRAEMIRSVGFPSHDAHVTMRFEEGDKVEADYKGRGRWFPGVVKRDNRDGTFDINYDDGEREMNVRNTSIRRREHSSPSRSTNNGAKLKQGDKIEADYKGRGRWHPGTIRRDNFDDTFDIDYDNGDRELNVRRDFIRRLDERADSKSTSTYHSDSKDGRHVTDDKGNGDSAGRDDPKGSDVRDTRVATLSRSGRRDKSEFLYDRGQLVACYWYKLSVYGRARAFTKPKPALVLNHNIDGT